MTVSFVYVCVFFLSRLRESLVCSVLFCSVTFFIPCSVLFCNCWNLELKETPLSAMDDEESSAVGASTPASHAGVAGLGQLLLSPQHASASSGGGGGSVSRPEVLLDRYLKWLLPQVQHHVGDDDDGDDAHILLLR